MDRVVDRVALCCVYSAVLLGMKQLDEMCVLILSFMHVLLSLSLSSFICVHPHTAHTLLLPLTQPLRGAKWNDGALVKPCGSWGGASAPDSTSARVCVSLVQTLRLLFMGLSYQA